MYKPALSGQKLNIMETYVSIIFPIILFIWLILEYRVLRKIRKVKKAFIEEANWTNEFAQEFYDMVEDLMKTMKSFSEKLKEEKR